MKSPKLLWMPILLLVALLLVSSGCASRTGLGANALTSTDKVEVIKDAPYYHGKFFDRNKHILDLYIPRGVKRFPVIFFVHGGAWIGGDKAATAGFGMAMAERGIGVVNINYRLYPFAKYPLFVEDVARAFEWTVKNIASHGGDTEAIFTAGHSAGGHLSALIATNEGFLKDRGLSLANIRGEIGISGIYRMTNERFRKIFTKDEKTRRDSSPIEHVTKNTPPFLLFYADQDIEDLPQQAKDMDAELKKGRTPERLVMAQNRTHNTILGRIGTAGDPATEEILKFVRQNLPHAKGDAGIKHGTPRY